jgi:glycerate 2-kinase
LAGGLLVAGARIERGFFLVADLVDLVSRIRAADLVITGEGAFDATSAEGKVVWGVASLAAESGTQVVVIAGRIDEAAVCDSELYPAVIEVLDLCEMFGADRCLADPAGCAAIAAETVLSNRTPR